MTVNAEKFEELLSAELKASLDGQRGKSVAAFRGYVAGNQAAEETGENNGGEDGAGRQDGRWRPASKSGRFGRQISRREAWFWTTGPSLLAASLGIALALQFAIPRMQHVAVPGISAPGVDLASDNPKPSDFAPTGTMTRDWVDPSDSTVHYRMTEPVENVNDKELRPF